MLRKAGTAVPAAELLMHQLTVLAIIMCNAFHERNQFYFFPNVSNTLSVGASSAMASIFCRELSLEILCEGLLLCYI